MLFSGGFCQYSLKKQRYYIEKDKQAIISILVKVYKMSQKSSFGTKNIEKFGRLQHLDEIVMPTKNIPLVPVTPYLEN